MMLFFLLSGVLCSSGSEHAVLVSAAVVFLSKPGPELQGMWLQAIVIMLWTWVHCINVGVAVWEESMKEMYCKTPLRKYRIRKESNCIRKGLGLIVLGEVKGLNIHNIKMTCIHVGDKQEQSI